MVMTIIWMLWRPGSVDPPTAGPLAPNDSRLTLTQRSLQRQSSASIDQLQLREEEAETAVREQCGIWMPWLLPEHDGPSVLVGGPELSPWVPPQQEGHGQQEVLKVWEEKMAEAAHLFPSLASCRERGSGEPTWRVVEDVGSQDDVERR